ATAASRPDRDAVAPANELSAPTKLLRAARCHVRSTKQCATRHPRSVSQFIVYARWFFICCKHGKGCVGAFPRLGPFREQRTRFVCLTSMASSHCSPHWG